jgi:hypothetical protein
MQKNEKRSISKSDSTSGLVGAERCRELVFPDPESRPCLRSFQEWKSRGLLPYRKIGRRIWFCPEEVRAALDNQFKIHPRRS